MHLNSTTSLTSFLTDLLQLRHCTHLQVFLTLSNSKWHPWASRSAGLSLSGGCWAGLLSGCTWSLSWRPTCTVASLRMRSVLSLQQPLRWKQLQCLISRRVTDVLMINFCQVVKISPQRIRYMYSNLKDNQCQYLPFPSTELLSIEVDSVGSLDFLFLPIVALWDFSWTIAVDFSSLFLTIWAILEADSRLLWRFPLM